MDVRGLRPQRRRGGQCFQPDHARAVLPTGGRGAAPVLPGPQRSADPPLERVSGKCDGANRGGLPQRHGRAVGGVRADRCGCPHGNRLHRLQGRDHAGSGTLLALRPREPWSRGSLASRRRSPRARQQPGPGPGPAQAQRQRAQLRRHAEYVDLRHHEPGPRPARDHGHHEHGKRNLPVHERSAAILSQARRCAHGLRRPCDDGCRHLDDHRPHRSPPHPRARTRSRSRSALWCRTPGPVSPPRR